MVNEGHHARTYRKGAWAAPNDRGAAADKRMRAGSYYQQMVRFHQFMEEDM
ncbi:MAG: hypothetical protein ACXAHE_11400 [Roseburia sp. 1XD42-69]